MTATKLTMAQERWVLSKLPPCPDVFVLAYAGTSRMEWKLVEMYCRNHSRAHEDWEAVAREHYPSAKMVRVFMVESPRAKTGGGAY